jgi:hypothetical protein
MLERLWRGKAGAEGEWRAVGVDIVAGFEIIGEVIWRRGRIPTY